MELTLFQATPPSSLTRDICREVAIGRHERVVSVNARIGDLVEHIDEQGQVGHQLPPVDGGAAAWKVLFGAFVFEALLWGERFRYIPCYDHNELNSSCRISIVVWCFPRTIISRMSRFVATTIFRL